MCPGHICSNRRITTSIRQQPKRGGEKKNRGGRPCSPSYPLSWEKTRRCLHPMDIASPKEGRKKEKKREKRKRRNTTTETPLLQLYPHPLGSGSQPSTWDGRGKKKRPPTKPIRHPFLRQLSSWSMDELGKKRKGKKKKGKRPIGPLVRTICLRTPSLSWRRKKGEKKKEGG